MHKDQLEQLVLYVVDKVNDLGGYTTTIRLVKYLYLIDLEYYRRYRYTLTGMDWIFYRYGPFAFELPKIGEDLGFDLQTERFETAKGHTGRLFRVQGPVQFPRGISKIKSMVDNLLKIWADYETIHLLRYTYETEPMQEVVYNEQIDFAVVPEGSLYYEIQLNIDKAASAMIQKGLQEYAEGEMGDLVIPETRWDQSLVDGIADLGNNENYEYNFPGISPEVDLEHFHDTLPKGE
jgi:hypothetical protein